jgi:hypothetical protein
LKLGLRGNWFTSMCRYKFPFRHLRRQTVYTQWHPLVLFFARSMAVSRYMRGSAVSEEPLHRLNLLGCRHQVFDAFHERTWSFLGWAVSHSLEYSTLVETGKQRFLPF